MATTTAKRVFPLLLTAFERLMLLNDLPEFPSSIIIQLTLTGEIDRPAFEAALDEALARHPLLRAVVKKKKRNLPSWVPASGQRPQVDWAPEGTALETPHGENVDLASEPGLRIWIRQGDNRVLIVLQFHHSSTDGIGCYRFIGDLLALYGMRTVGDGEAPELAPLDPGLLRNRTRKMYYGSAEDQAEAGMWFASGGGGRIAMLKSGMRYLLKYFVRGVSPLQLAAPRGDSRRQAFPGIVSTALDKEQHRQLRLAAADLGVTPNDLLVAALFRTVCSWNRRGGGLPFGRRYRVLVPTDLRGRGDELAPAANYVGWVLLTRSPRQCRSIPQLLQSIRAETASTKHHNRGTEFTRAITGALFVPGLLPAIAKGRQSCFPTAVLTNMGDETRRWTARFPRRKGQVICGNLALEEITGAAPLEPRTRACVAIGAYRRKLTVCVRSDPYSFDEQAARELLEIFVAQVQECMDSAKEKDRQSA